MAVKKVRGQLFSENVFAVSQLMNYSWYGKMNYFYKIYNSNFINSITTIPWEPV